MSCDVDHLVLPVSSLDLARKRLSLLGFTIAANARHPFGTDNACVFLKDGTYLEPLAISDAQTYSANAAAGNAFVAKDKQFRDKRGQDGFSALVAKSDDADSDHQRFVAAQMSGGDAFSFSRPVTLPDGGVSEASFRLAFASYDESDFFFFACQRIAALPADRSSLERHENGVTGIHEVVLSANSPDDFAALVETVFGVSAVKDSDGELYIQTSNVGIRVLTPASAHHLFDTATQNTASGLTGEGIVFSVSDLAVTAAVLAANGVAYTRKGTRLLVQPASGQGAIFAFEELE
ncbi:hypothetical protein RRU01S_14_01800 [Agrobacterium rubi TR3 = NBRC 13261]|uniref:Glyoxalase-like domain-containing protein n=1 Tax=Agrobacterium rubi TR3 = NBRC 13261 TaxID=1368415 RepID=A0A081CWB1_9HYPH|nr:VOC family protein [Agrobacterium rubi]MBP1877920.1 catechol 2,3-dioxygenase-like lactoylglutathione lyase family enzyme [Agrobacterium rubi]MCL6651894.1 lactoylglutathione lyase [Agrobacterium rubi]GAK70957.1 hypothetical protein RRU01S_14_01800 [Agrobacterium rubi TR3 = NBRC 13261]